MTSKGTRRSRFLAAAAAGMVAGFLCGCTPKGDSGGRVGVHETTKAERKSGVMHPSDLATASDAVAMAFAADLNRLSERDWGGYRVSLVFGDINNSSRAMATTDFEYVRERIKNKLMQSRMFRDNVKVVANRARMEELNRREYGEPDDPLQEGRPAVGVQRTDPAYTFYMNGDVYGVHRGTTHLYYLTFKLHRASDGEEVFAKDYEVKYGRK